MNQIAARISDEGDQKVLSALKRKQGKKGKSGLFVFYHLLNIFEKLSKIWNKSRRQNCSK